MSTIASPRPSLSTAASIRSPTSTPSRTSLDTPPPGSLRAPTQPRRHRAALRDYYNLKSAAAAAADAGAATPPIPEDGADYLPPSEVAEIDRAGFDADTYVAELLEKRGLDEVLRVEAGLVGEIRGLDGERKALVYDNYSKLIKGTDTIKKMRTNMDPLAPATSTLSPAIAHIAETAASLSASLTGHLPARRPDAVVVGQGEAGREERERQTVRWVLAAPARLREMRDGGRDEEAGSEWEEVKRLLDRWEGVRGVDAVRRRCEEVMEGDG